jgi:hypothetical protein
MRILREIWIGTATYQNTLSFDFIQRNSTVCNTKAYMILKRLRRADITRCQTVTHWSVNFCTQHNICWGKKCLDQNNLYSLLICKRDIWCVNLCDCYRYLHYILEKKQVCQRIMTAPHEMTLQSVGILARMSEFIIQWDVSINESM